jgi:ATP-dependent RNA helicase RhlE
MEFEHLNLIQPLLAAVQDEGYTTATPIQAQAIPHVLAGRDVLGCAQTGTGKTAAFALPILQRLSEAPHSRGRRAIRVLALAPTRELAAQIAESFQTYGARTHVRQTVVFGGVGKAPQIRDLTRGVDVLVATPGRLLDLMGDGYLSLEHVDMLVLDEADRMLDMGFIHDIRRVVKAMPSRRQTLLFSATLPPAIRELADGILDRPVSVSVTPPSSTVEAIEQAVFAVEKINKIPLLVHLLGSPEAQRVLVFTRTKYGADKVVRKLFRAQIPSGAIHGNKTQGQRERALSLFKEGASRVLVATDIASRGLDIDSLSHVINFDLPNEPEVYVHRIGRTGRAGAAGMAWSFCSADEREHLIGIERLTKQKLPIVGDNPFPLDLEPTPSLAPPPRQAPSQPRPGGSGHGHPGRGGGGGRRRRGPRGV